MDIPEFEDLLDRLGEDMSRWPAAQRQTALALLAQSSEARELLREAQDMRGLLSPSPVRAPVGLADRIVEQAIKRSPPEVQSDGASLLDQARNFIQANFSFGRLSFLSVCLLAGLYGGVLHSRIPEPERTFAVHDFFAYIIDLNHITE